MDGWVENFVEHSKQKYRDDNSHINKKQQSKQDKPLYTVGLHTDIA